MYWTLLHLVIKLYTTGKYHRAKVMEFNQKLSEEYGGILKLPGVLGI